MDDYRAVTNLPAELVGKTIVGATAGDPDHGLLWEFKLDFSDGSSVYVRPEGYEVEGVQLVLDSPEGQASRDAQHAENERRYEAAKAARAEREREKAIIREQKRQELSPAKFEQWLREQNPAYILQQVWGESLQRQFYESSPFLDLLKTKADQ